MSRALFPRWCSPRTVLLVMGPSDDPAQVLAALRYAELSGAKLLLAQMNAEGHGGANPKAESRSMRSVPLSQIWRNCDAASSFMSLDILRRAFVLNAVSDHQIPALVRTFNIDRVLLTLGRGADVPTESGIQERLIAISPVPVWVMGRGMGLNLGTPPPTRRILLPVSHSPEDAFSLQFAWELATSEGASLSVLHVFGRSELGRTGGEKSPLTVKSWLPIDKLAETSLVSMIEIAVRQGDPATEIVEFNSYKAHDLVILRCSAVRRPRWATKPDIVGSLCSRMSCPLLVLGSSIDRSEHRSPFQAPGADRRRAELHAAAALAGEG